MIGFSEHDHRYFTLNNPEDRWLSGTGVVGQFKNPFDAIPISEKVVKKKTSKWYGLDPEEVRGIWKAETDRSCVTGTRYHAMMERDVLEQPTFLRNDAEL